MSSLSELERGLRNVLEILGDYTTDLVLVGGWVPYLHLRYGRGAVPSPHTSLTAEADLLIPTGLRRGNRTTSRTWRPVTTGLPQRSSRSETASMSLLLGAT